MMHATMKTFAILLLVSLGTLFSLISSGFAQESGDSELKAPPALTPVQPVQEPWAGKTVGLQLTAVPLALGVAAANFYLGLFVSHSYYDNPLRGDEELEFNRRIFFALGSGIFGYTLSQGLLIGAIGDATGGDGGMWAPTAVGVLIPWVWIGMLQLMDLERLMGLDSCEPGCVAGIVATTFVAQLVAYHLSASFFDDEPSALSNLSFGLAPTDGGVSAGLGFQF